MSSLFNSPLWYRVADLKPELSSHATIHRQVYRGHTWYVIQDHASGRAHRFAPIAYQFIGLMDGQRTVDQVQEITEASLGDDALTQKEVIEILARLHAADLLKAEVTPDTRELFRRHQARENQKLKQRFWSPLAVRIPLIDPDRYLERLLPFVRPLIGRLGILAWLGVVVTAFFLAVSHWPELTHNVVDRVLTPKNIFLLWLSYPIIKLFHEIGHAIAAKNWGGEIHEMGIMFLVLMPMPYVDASSTSAFTDKKKRILVSAAGIMVELFLASLALLLWLAIEPGLVRSLAFNVMFIGGISTVLFNANPLLRFDGYYMLADWTDIPNLAGRSKQYLGYLCKKFMYAVPGGTSPATADGERAWFICYSLGSFVYRMIIIVAIILFVATKFFFVGVILAVWAATTQLLFPALKSVNFLLTSQELQPKRSRALVTTGLIVATIGGLLFFAPVPLWTVAEGVVWAPQDSEVRTKADGVVVRIIAAQNSLVRPGDPLIETEDPALASRVKILEADLAEATARYSQAMASNLVEANIIKDDINTINAELALAHERLGDLIIRSPAAGVFIIDRPQDFVGRYFEHGNLIAYVVDSSKSSVQVVVSQDDIGLIQRSTQAVSVRLSERLDESVNATVRQARPSATDRLPSAVLGTLGGGSLPVDPIDPEGLKLMQDIFQIELTLENPATRLGGRAYVRFDHGSEPLAQQWYRRVRQLFLSRFNV